MIFRRKKLDTRAHYERLADSALEQIAAIKRCIQKAETDGDDRHVDDLACALARQTERLAEARRMKREVDCGVRWRVMT